MIEESGNNIRSKLKLYLDELNLSLETNQKSTSKKPDQILEERARRLAETTTTRTDISNKLEIIKFSLGREHYAIETKFVHEVINISKYTVIPGSPEFLTGVVLYKGEITPLISLQKLFDVQTIGLSDLSQAIVLGLSSFDFLMLCDVVDEISFVDEKTLNAVPEWAINIEQNYIKAITSDNTVILDGNALLLHPALTQKE